MSEPPKCLVQSAFSPREQVRIQLNRISSRNDCSTACVYAARRGPKHIRWKWRSCIHSNSVVRGHEQGPGLISIGLYPPAHNGLVAGSSPCEL